MLYPNILSRLINTPLLITSDKLEILTDRISLKMLADEPIDSTEKSKVTSGSFDSVDKIALIKVHGSLVNKNGAGASGLTSYESITNQIHESIKQNYTTILFDIASCGGEVSGVFGLSSLIRSLEKMNITTVAFTDSQACSAAYLIASSCSKIFAVDIADVASIGAVMSLVDVTEADKKEGVSYTILRSKESKASYNPHETLSTAVKDELLAKLITVDNKFNNTVLEYRPNLSLETVVKLAGKTISAEEGVKVGLVDKIVTSIADVMLELVSTSNTVVNNTNNEGILMSTEEKYIELLAQHDSLKASTTLEVSKAVKEERIRVQKVMEAGKTFNVSDVTITNAIVKGYSLDQVSDLFSDIAEARGENTAINAAATSMSSVDDKLKAELSKLAAAQVSAETDTLGNGTFSMLDLVSAMSDLGEKHGK